MQAFIEMIQEGWKELLGTLVACAIISPVLYAMIILTLEEMAR